MRKFAIAAKKDEESSTLEIKMKETLIHAGWQEDKQSPELVICIGGDGTFLYAVHKYMDLSDQVSFIGVHTGTLGFFTDYTKEEAENCLKDLIEKEPTYREVSLLEIQCDEKDSVYALNEMRIENIIRTQELEVKIDDEHFESFRGTGMCVCTQMGSTAYNRSLKGAVIEQDLELIQLHEITGIHHHKYRSLGVPFILNSHRKITFTSNNFTDAFLCYDFLNISLNDTKKITVQLSNRKIRFAKYKEVPYLDRLKNLY